MHRKPALTIQQQIAVAVTDRDCLIWQGSVNSEGSPRLKVAGRWVGARPLIWLHEHGASPLYRLAPTCGKRLCIAHLAREERPTGPKAKCLSGRHDLTDPRNRAPMGDHEVCKPCLRQRQLEWSRAKRAKA